MNYAKFKLLVLFGRKLLFPPQVKKLINFLLYRINFTHTPLNVLLAVTARCNKNCSFCYFNGELNKADSERFEMSYDTFKKIINHRLVKNSLRIHFTGGEPLLNKDIFKMVNEAKRRKHIVSIGTNGLLLSKFSSELLNNPPDILSISFNPEDEKKLIDVLPIFKGKIPIKLNFVMTKDNVKHIESLIQIAINNSVKMIDINQVHFQTGENNGLPDEEYLKIKKSINKDYGSKLSISWSSRNMNKAAQMKCKVFWHSIHIDALGQVSPCCQYPLSTYHGNIFTEDAWNSSLMATLRREVKDGKTPKLCKNCQTVSEDYMGL